MREEVGVLSSRLSTMKMGDAYSKILATTYKITQHHNPQDTQMFCCENLRHPTLEKMLTDVFNDSEVEYQNAANNLTNSLHYHCT
jgi:hypothetical protein